ncbi:subtilisin-like protease SBT3.9 [Humulus lupulus]|uniref:subtilisin-like protease SBT3.9 n=1 Tax=Humulus lupulus TaxID=3486 RepID=UPI002B413D83|nr:subtilisin-like protease SBT3.9 [Humulus lupulus]
MKFSLQTKNNNTSLLFVFIYLLISVISEQYLLTSADPKSNVYIIHMGKKQHEDLKLLKKTHHEVLTTVLGSKEESVKAMVYSYKHGFSGFAAKLTKTQAQTISELPGVAQVIPNQLFKVQTTRSWDYLQLSSRYQTHYDQISKLGDGAIIGLLDTGIWPESETFSDKGLGPIPSRWKGMCESGENFNGTKHCNKKLIGARYFIKALEAEYGKPYISTESGEFLSPRDSSGHGTHTSTIAAGSSMANRSYNGLGSGTVRGGATQARIAMYKVCWSLLSGGICAGADILKAFDEAIRDGVDVLSVSIAADTPSYPEVDDRNAIAIGAFHAVAKGVVVVCSAGNAGPSPQTVQNASPWILTVGASSVDRSFPTVVTLGNNWSTTGQAMFTGAKTGFIKLAYPEVSDLKYPRDCKNLRRKEKWMRGSVVLCFTSSFKEGYIEDTAYFVKKAGALGLIVAENPTTALYSCDDDFPCVQVSYDVAMNILYYFRTTKSPKVRISPTKTHDGRPVSTKLAYFSSRGPSSVAPAILKPDIAAPGVNILSAVSPSDPKKKNGFAFMSGTSMATPHISGIVALLKSLHPDWSPAAIKSAIVTTAWNSDPSGEPIFAEGETMKLADPFDYGGGIVNFNSAVNPGLVYDMGTSDYIYYLCSMGYKASAIAKLGQENHTTTSTTSSSLCPNKKKPNTILNLNLPTITIPSLRRSTSFRRRVTNVGPTNSVYQAIVNPPQGIRVSIRPRFLVFNSTTKILSFRVTVSSSHKVTTGYYFGSLTWTDGVHAVRSPVSVRTELRVFSN